MSNRWVLYAGWNQVSRLLQGILICLGLLAFQSASAAIVVTSTIGVGPSYALGFSNFIGGPNHGNGGVTALFLNLPGTATTQGAGVAVDKVSEVDGGNFHFKANTYCTVNCFASTNGVTTLTILNDSDSAVDLRFDSQITAGHLGFQSLFDRGNATSATFDFSVTELRSSAPNGILLYGATGVADANNLSIVTSDGSKFNGLDSFMTDTQKVYDWSPTNLDLGLGILAPHETIQLLYRSDTLIRAGSTCTTLACTDAVPCAIGAMCDGAQVCFGDPRNSGGVTGRSARAAPAAVHLEPVIGRQCDTATVTFDVVAAGSPLPPTPPVLPPVIYAPMPEPASWALMLTGFGLSGVALRRRRSGAPA